MQVERLVPEPTRSRAWAGVDHGMPDGQSLTLLVGSAVCAG